MRGMTRTLERAATRAVGLQASVTGLRRQTFGGDGVYRTKFTFTDMPITVTDALAYASQKIFDFPLGRINIKGGRASLAFAVTSVRADTINDSAAMDWSIGTAAASSITLASTMVDIVAKQDHTLDGAVAAYTAAVAANVAAAAAYDGTVTAKDAYLNVGFPTNTEIDADGTMTVTGSLELHWEHWGVLAGATA